MYKIQEAEMLANNIYRMVVEAPRVAQHCLPGQFVIVKADEEGERIPLTICDYDREAGTITIVFMPIGESTKKMKDLKAGDAFMDFVGTSGAAVRVLQRRYRRTEEKTDRIRSRRCWNCTGLPAVKMAA